MRRVGHIVLTRPAVSAYKRGTEWTKKEPDPKARLKSSGRLNVWET
jgi:hypothetical protein